jgi:hypothetical protein
VKYPDSFDLRAALDQLQLSEPLLAGMIELAIPRLASLVSASAEAASGDDEDEDDIEASEADSREEWDVTVGTAADDETEPWIGLVAPYVHAVLLAITEHRSWAQQEVGLDPNTPLIRSADLAVTLDGRFRRWKSYVSEMRLPSHRQRDAVGPRNKIETVMALQLDAIQRLVPIATPEMRKFLEALNHVTGTERVPAVDLLGRPYPRGWDIKFRHALGTAFCWLVVDFYAAAWNRHWSAELGTASDGAPFQA